MSRRHRAQKREVLPDPKFGDLVVTKFMNYVMYEGKKAVAENIVYGAFDLIKTKSGREFWDARRIKLPIFGQIAHKIVLARFGGAIRVAGTVEFTGFDERIDQRRVAPILDAARELLSDSQRLGV